MINKLKQSYKRLLKEVKIKGFLSGALIIAEPNRITDATWQISFYDPESDKMSNYIIEAEIKSEKPQEVIKNKEFNIEELDLKEIKINLNEAVELLNEKLKEKHETANKFIIILQKLKVPIWNITALTNSFNVLHLKINATNKEIIEEKIDSVINFKSD